MKKVMIAMVAVVILGGGCKKKTSSSPATVADSGGGGGPATTEMSGGGGGTAGAVRGAVQRKAVNANDMKQIHLFIDTASGASGRLPSASETLATLRKEMPKVAELVDEGVIVLLNPKSREEIWAYEAKALEKRGWVASGSGVEEMDKDTLKARLGEISVATVYVNDMPVPIGDAKLNAIQVAERAGVLIPSYCYHPALTVVASCRMCLIEMGELKEGKVAMQSRLLPGCQTAVKDGSVIVTGEYAKRDPNAKPLPYKPNYKPGAAAKKAQADTLEGLLLNHPLDCPVCDKAGECKLQDYSFQFGRSETRLADEKNQPPNKPGISSTIALFTDRCIMCTRCVRFTREISGTGELYVNGRTHHEEIDVFPGRPLENKLAGNVVDLCPVGALASKDFLYTQRVWYLKSSDGVCPNCSTGCSVHVDANKEIVYRLRARENPEAQGYFICDEGRYGFHYADAENRIRRPMMNGVPTPWSVLAAKLKNAITEAVLLSPRRVVVVLSPFLTVEEAFALGTAFKKQSEAVRLVLGTVPVAGEDDHYPKDAKGRPVEPRTFTIRAEKCPNRRGVEAVLRHLQGEVIGVESVNDTDLAAVWYTGGYPVPQAVKLTAPLLVVQELLPSVLSDVATFVLPATTVFEKDGTFVNHAGLAQTFARAVRPPAEARSELQLAWDLAGRKGLATAAAVRRELAQAMPEFASLAEEKPAKQGRRLELATV